jgi:hypothetical protein
VKQLSTLTDHIKTLRAHGAFKDPIWISCGEFIISDHGSRIYFLQITITRTRSILCNLLPKYSYFSVWFAASS